MASSEGSSFEAMIHADRARKKNEDLANQIFGRTKSSPNNKKAPKEVRSPSLASRMGVQKRSSSTSTPTQKSFNPPSRPSSTTPSHRNQSQLSTARTSRMVNEIDSGNANVTTSRNSFTKNKPFGRNGAPPLGPSQPSQGPGLSIKGSAGPFTIHASNFAPGTTEADIEAALQGELLDESGINSLQSCRLVSTRPAVVAEMVLSEKSVAERIVKKFNNLKADGRMLRVEFVPPATIQPTPRKNNAIINNNNNDDDLVTSIEPVPLESEDSEPVAPTVDTDMDDMDLQPDYPPTSYDHEREAADRDRRDRDRNRDEYATTRRDDRPREDRDRRRDDRDRDHDRDRERERDRDRDRERDLDHERDREYDRRESQLISQPQSYDNRPPPPQQQPPPASYGNGYTRPSPRGGYGYGYGGRGGGGGYGFSRGSYGGRGAYNRGYSR